GISVESGGTFSIGTSVCSVGTIAGQSDPTVQVTFTGLTADNGTNGIVVQNGGSLLLFGSKGVPSTNADDPVRTSWTYLASPAGPTGFGPGTGTLAPGTGSPTALQVLGKVDWTAGDWIAVGTTNYVADDTEFVKIASAPSYNSNTNLTTIALTTLTPLKFYHFGGPDPGLAANPASLGKPSASYTGNAAHNYGVDERAEVALISRAIKLTATTPAPSSGGKLISPQPACLHCGGEIDVQAGATASIQGVEIEKFGKGGTVGSYPINFIWQPNSALVKANSIHHSYNHGVVLTGANNLTIQNNVVARAVGHLFYLVKGTEAGNTFQSNVGLGAMNNTFTAPADLTAFWGGDNM